MSENNTNKPAMDIKKPTVSPPPPPPSTPIPNSQASDINVPTGVNKESSNNQSVPEEIKGLNWGAFFLTFIWGIAHNVWISLLVFLPIINIIMPFILLFKGNEWAWKNRHFNDVTQFKAVQKKWAIWGIGLLVLQLILGAVMVIAIMSAEPFIYEESNYNLPNENIQIPTESIEQNVSPDFSPQPTLDSEIF